MDDIPCSNPDLATLKVSRVKVQSQQMGELCDSDLLKRFANQLIPIEDSTTATPALQQPLHKSIKESMVDTSSLKRSASSDEALLDHKLSTKLLKTTTSNARRKNSAGKISSTPGRWSGEEHAAFLKGLAIYGREWKRVAADIPTRSASQVRSHAQKYFAKIQKDQEDEWISRESSSSSVGSASGRKLTLLDSVNSPMLPKSVRQEAERILANPKAVEQEVRDTLQQLQERYLELQQRLEQRNSVESNQSAVAASDDEMIALDVLQGGLRSDGSRSEGSSTN